MLKDFGCSYVIVGHSERREYFREGDHVVAMKYGAAQDHGLILILCVGESLEERESEKTEEVVARQLDEVLDAHGIDSFQNAVIAYEPIWAIGTGKTATPEMAQEVHAFIRRRLAEQDPNVAAKVRILYGGSMKPENSKELIAQADIDGGLIGGASLKAEDFLGIARSAE
jgi:triosephosphate isomerase